MKLLTEILERNAREYPNVPALTMRMGYRTVSLTYAQTYEMAQRVVVWLAHEGLKKGDKVLLFAPNSPYWVIFFFGCMLAGVIPVPLNIQMTIDQIERIANQAGAQVIMAYLMFRQDLPPSIKRYDIETLPDIVQAYDIKDFKQVDLLEDDLVEIMYTSGTTGDPKGVPLTHKNIMSNITALTEVFDLRPARERLLSILPLSHILEQTIGLMLAFWYAAHIIYAHSPTAIRSLMKKYNVSKMVAVPEFLHILMARIEHRAQAYYMKWLISFLMKVTHFCGNWSARILFAPMRHAFGGALNTVASGGAPLDPSLEMKWNDIGIIVLQGYGLTETSPTITTNTYAQRRIGSVGKPISNVEIKIEEKNELLVKGPNVFSGYFKNEEKTKEAFTEDGWFKTGDLAEMDADGFVFIKGREKYVIIGPGGQNVYPEDIEDELSKISGVRDSAVVGAVKDNTTEIHAVLLLDASIHDKADDIVTQVNDKLASYQRITAWTIWPEQDFPRSATRKIQKEKVKEFLKQADETKDTKMPTKVTPLIRILSYVSGVSVDRITPETKVLAQLHLDSLMRVELIARVEEELGITIDESHITRATTVADLQEMIDKHEPIKKAPSKIKRWPRSWWACGLRVILQYMFWGLARIWIRLRVRGTDHLKDIKGPIIFMANHTSYADPVVVAMALPFKLREKLAIAAAYDVLYDYYRPGAWLAELGFNAFSFPRKEQEHVTVGLNNMGEMLDDGYNVLLFPEGRISENGKLQELKAGAGVVAVLMDATIVPVLIADAQKILPYEKFVPRQRGTITVIFGVPLQFNKSDNPAEVTQQIFDAIRKIS